jgi:hypothetical protein
MDVGWAARICASQDSCCAALAAHRIGCITLIEHLAINSICGSAKRCQTPSFSVAAIFGMGCS